RVKLDAVAHDPGLRVLDRRGGPVEAVAPVVSLEVGDLEARAHAAMLPARAHRERGEGHRASVTEPANQMLLHVEPCLPVEAGRAGPGSPVTPLRAQSTQPTLTLEIDVDRPADGAAAKFHVAYDGQAAYGNMLISGHGCVSSTDTQTPRTAEPAARPGRLWTSRYSSPRRPSRTRLSTARSAMACTGRMTGRRCGTLLGNDA